MSFRLGRETKARLMNHLEGTGCTFADFVKDSLGREQSMVEKRVTTLASRKIDQKPQLDSELHKVVLDLARWGIVFWANLRNPRESPCPGCLFPSKMRKNQESRTVTLQMLENGDLKCPECGLTLRNPPQLAWNALVLKVMQEYEREKLLEAEQTKVKAKGDE